MRAGTIAERETEQQQVRALIQSSARGECCNEAYTNTNSRCHIQCATLPAFSFPLCIALILRLCCVELLWPTLQVTHVKWLLTLCCLIILNPYHSLHMAYPIRPFSAWNEWFTRRRKGTHSSMIERFKC